MPLSMTMTKAVKIAAALIAAAYTLVLAFGAREGFPTGLSTGSLFPYLSDQPVGEDGYYLMLAAWNLARGEGLTANFGEVVTGIQPLMTFLLAGVARIVQAFGGDKFDFARAMILLGGANLLVFAILIERVVHAALPVRADRATAGALAFGGVALSFYLFRTFTYGLETGLYLALFAALVWATLRTFAHGKGATAPSLAQAAGLGVLVGLCGLARIDFGVVAAIAFGLLFLQRRVGFVACVLAGALALAATAPWFLWVRGVSGSFMPSSGPAQATLVDLGSAAGRGETMFLALAQNFAPWAPLSYGPVVSALALLLLLALLLIARHGAAQSFWREGTRGVIAAWGVGVLALPVIYFAFFWAAHFYARYTAPIVILALLVTVAAAARLPDRARRAFTALAFVFILAVNAWAAWDTHHRGDIGDGHSVAAGYVANQLPKDARVGAFQSGVVGFYNGNVINLDGKVNVDALAAMRAKRVEEYVDAERIDYVIDWEGVVEGLMPRAMQSGEWIRCPLPVGNRETICVTRKR